MSELTTAQAAARAGITVRGVRKAIERGALPACKVGRDWLITEVDLVVWIGRRAPKPGAIDSQTDSHAPGHT